MTHELKIWPQYYCRVADGSKTFELRKNDRGFQPGDVVNLREYDPTEPHESLKFKLSPMISFRIGYVLPISGDRVVFSLLPIEPNSVSI